MAHRYAVKVAPAAEEDEPELAVEATPPEIEVVKLAAPDEASSRAAARRLQHPLEGPLVRALDQQRTKALRRRMEVLIEAEEAKKRGTRALPASKEKLAIRVAQSMGRASEEELSDLRKSQALPMRPSHE